MLKKKKLVHLDAVLDSGSLRVSVFGLCSCSQPGLGRGMYTCPSGQGLEETGIAFLGALLTRIPLSPLADLFYTYFPVPGDHLLLWLSQHQPGL